MKYKTFKEILIENHSKSIINQKKELKKSFDDWKGDLEQVDEVLVIGVNF